MSSTNCAGLGSLRRRKDYRKSYGGGIRRAVGKINAYGKDVQKRFTRDRLVYDQDIHEIARLSGNETLAKTLAQVFERIILKRRTDGLYDPPAASQPIRST